MVAITGLEPVRITALGFEASVSTSSTISPLVGEPGVEPGRINAGILSPMTRPIRLFPLLEAPPGFEPGEITGPRPAALNLTSPRGYDFYFLKIQVANVEKKINIHESIVPIAHILKNFIFPSILQKVK